MLRFHRLPTLITGAVTGANVLVGVLALYSVMVSRQQYEERAEILSRNVASAIDQNVSSSFGKIDLALQATVDELERQDAAGKPDEVSMRAFLARIERRLPEIENVRVTDANGVIVMRSSPPDGTAVSVADRDYFIHFRDHADGDVYVSSPMVGRLLNKPLIPFVREYRRHDGSFGGVVYATVSVERLGWLLRQYDIGPHGTLVLRDGHLGLIARVPEIAGDPAGQVGNVLVSPELRSRYEAGATSTTFLNSFGGDGVHRIVTLRRLAKVPIVVIAGIASVDYLDSWWNEVYLTLGLFMGFLLLSVVSTVLVLRFLGQSRRLRLGSEAALDRLQKIASRVPGMVYQFHLRADGHSALPYASDAIREVFRVAPEDVREDATRAFQAIHPDDYDEMQESIQKSAREMSAWRHEYRVKFSDGTVRWHLGNAMPDSDGQGGVLWHGFITDITGQKAADEKLRLASTVFTHAREAISITDADGTIIEVNDAFTRITGYRREEVIGQNHRILSSGRQDPAFYRAMWKALGSEGHWSGEIWNRRKDGGLIVELITISAVLGRDGRPEHYVALFSDITALKEHQQQLEHIAHYDALTHLPNRLLLADRLQQAMAQAQRRNQLVAVVYLDLDGFKGVNDRHGHDKGDQLLVHVADAMREALRESDTLARLGGDEFVAVLGDLGSVGECEPVLERLMAAAAAPMPCDGFMLQCSASAGVAMYPQSEDIASEQLMRQADQAMYEAKLAGKNRYHVFDAAHDSNLRLRGETLARIRQALDTGEFVLHYQPKVNLRTGRIVGVEALIRWEHPVKGLLAPGVFLPVIEDHPLAIELGEWVISTALAQIGRWKSDGMEMNVSVNVGAQQLQQVDFVARLRFLLAAHPDVLASHLELEVLETSALADMTQVEQVIEECRQLGVMFALDDFGTGYSSLTYLKRLRVGLLKIDQSFVRDMLYDADDLAILQGIIGLAAAFGRDVVAEGVETIAHGTALLKLGCELAQGYAIAQPMPAAQLPGWAASWRPDPAWT